MKVTLVVPGHSVLFRKVTLEAAGEAPGMNLVSPMPELCASCLHQVLTWASGNGVRQDQEARFRIGHSEEANWVLEGSAHSRDDRHGSWILQETHEISGSRRQE